ncbi:hypothetical protein KOW79_020085 [Hemibagrus wyckioides]|uniref:Uncharacterized protein n=1 Tax=Hemibagrus wyckioides TaxID=337641 RepID=A0A9D3N889_9TELE|nr:hypothetical protein KOW79_020085 [Hemibagrus wyckioides]
MQIVYWLIYAAFAILLGTTLTAYLPLQPPPHLRAYRPPIKHQLAKMTGDSDVEAFLDASEHTADLLSRDAQLAYFTMDPEEAQDYEALKH